MPYIPKEIPYVPTIVGRITWFHQGTPRQMLVNQGSWALKIPYPNPCYYKNPTPTELRALWSSSALDTWRVWVQTWIRTKALCFYIWYSVSMLVFGWLRELGVRVGICSFVLLYFFMFSSFLPQGEWIPETQSWRISAPAPQSPVSKSSSLGLKHMTCTFV